MAELERDDVIDISLKADMAVTVSTLHAAGPMFSFQCPSETQGPLIM